MKLKFHGKGITRKINFIVWLVKKYWEYLFHCLVGFEIVKNNEYGVIKVIEKERTKNGKIVISFFFPTYMENKLPTCPTKDFFSWNVRSSFSTGKWTPWTKHTHTHKHFPPLKKKVFHEKTFPSNLTSPKSKINLF